MEVTKDNFITAIRRIGVLGTVEAGYFDNVFKSADNSAEIAALQAKDVQQDTLIEQVNVKTNNLESENVILGERVTILENQPAATDYSTQISDLQNKDITQDIRITNVEGSLLNKASLISGKVPYEQLPEFPVGRKVNVANQSSRFALSTYADLTIAYQSDTGDAWGLDANADPSISSNWSKLGNAQGVGVASFNGRTGNIGPMTGDYDTGKITELVDKRFVSSTQITSWDAKETTNGSQTKATSAQAGAKAYADSTFIPLSQKGSSSGVASLDSNGEIPVGQIKRNVAGGFPQLNTDGKLNNNLLKYNEAGGIAPLDANSKVPLANLPTPPIWRNPTGRQVGTWYTNNTPNVMVLNLRTASSTATSRFLNVQTRANASGTAFHQRSTALSTTGERWIQLSASVPPGWQYMVDTFGGSTTANTEYWHEMS